MQGMDPCAGPYIIHDSRVVSIFSDLLFLPSLLANSMTRVTDRQSSQIGRVDWGSLQPSDKVRVKGWQTLLNSFEGRLLDLLSLAEDTNMEADPVSF